MCYLGFWPIKFRYQNHYVENEVQLSIYQFGKAQNATMQSSDYGCLNIRMGGEFYFLFQIEILKLTCLGVPREGEREKRKSERAFGEDSQPTA